MPTKTWYSSTGFSRETRSFVDYPPGHPLTGTPPPAWSNSNKVDAASSGYVITGSSPGDWKKRIRSGYNATSSMLGDDSSASGHNDGFVSAMRLQTSGAGIGQTRIDEIRGCLGTYGNVSPSDPTHEILSVKNRVKLAIVDQIRSACTSLQGLVSAGEYGETLRLINGSARSIDQRTREYLGHVHRRARVWRSLRRSASEKLDWISKRWLEYSFGVKPLISDVKGGAQALARLMNYRPPTVNVRYASESSFNDEPLLVTRDFGIINLKLRVMRSYGYSYRIYGKVGIQPHSPSQFARAPILDEFGLRLDEFLPTLWELIPYSFMVDYFTNIGGMIDAASLNTNTVRWLASGSRATSELRSVVFECNQDPAGSGQKNSGFTFDPGSDFVRTRAKWSRGTFDPDFLIPELEFKVPGTTTKWLNMASLAILHRDVKLSLR